MDSAEVTDLQSGAYGQYPNAATFLIDDQKRTVVQVGCVTRKSRDKESPRTLRRDIAPSQLDNAGGLCLGGRKNGAEVQIVREYHITVFLGPSENQGIRSRRPSHVLPVQGIISLRCQYRTPYRRQVHVDKYFHIGAKGASISSARQDAYCSASVMSSGSRYGYSSRIFSREYPAATSPTSVPAVTRMPLMHGRPPITAGSNVIRDFISTVYKTLGGFHKRFALCEVRKNARVLKSSTGGTAAERDEEWTTRR